MSESPFSSLYYERFECPDCGGAIPDEVGHQECACGFRIEIVPADHPLTNPSPEFESVDATVPGAEAERLAGRSLEREIIAGVEHFKPGQHRATIEVRDAEELTNPPSRGDVGRVTYVDGMGHLCVVLTWRETGTDEWVPTWVGRCGMLTKHNPRPAPEGFALSEKMLRTLREADERGDAE